MTDIIDKAARVTGAVQIHLNAVRLLLDEPRSVNPFGIYTERWPVAANLKAIRDEIDAAINALVGAGQWPGPADYDEV